MFFVVNKMSYFSISGPGPPLSFACTHSSYAYKIMHQSFVVPAPMGAGNSGAFNFSVFKALLNALHCRATFMVKSLPKPPPPRRLTIMKNK